MRPAPITIFRRRASGGATSSSPSSPREERVGRGPRRGETNKNAPPLPGPLLHPMEEREKSRSLMQPWASGGAWVSPRACLETTRGAVFVEKAGWRGATKENIPGGSSTEEQRSQTAFSPKTLRAAGLLSVAGVGSFLTARCGDARK